MASDTFNSDSYFFKRDYRSSIRLNNLHWIVKGLVGYLVHPVVKLPREDAAVVDVGAGTAIWLQELASELSNSAVLQGFDNSALQFPSAAKWLAPNIKLNVHDCFRPYAEEHQMRYDLVHLQFFTCLLNDENAQAFLKNIVSLLKPGGYLQFFDHFPLEAKVKGSYSDETVSPKEFPASDALASMMHKPTPESSFDWTTHLHEIYEDCGLQVVAFDKFWCSEQYRLPWMQCKLLGLEDTVLNMGKDVAPRYQQMINGLVDDMTKGVTVEAPLFCVVGKRKEK